MSDYDSNYGERDYQDYADTFRDQWERDADEHDAERLGHSDRLHRDDPARTLCAAGCGRPGKWIYGFKCQVCHEAQREEKEAA